MLPCSVGLRHANDVNLNLRELLHNISVVIAVAAVRQTFDVLKKDAYGSSWFVLVDWCAVGGDGEGILVFPL